MIMRLIKNKYLMSSFLLLSYFQVCSIVFAESYIEIATPQKQMICFAVQRNRSHFKILNDPILKKFFAPDFVWHVNTFNDANEFQKMMKLLREVNPEIIIGSYASACLAMPEKEDAFLPAKIPFEQCKPEWFLRSKDDNYIKYPKVKNRFFLDVRQYEVRQAIISLAIARAKYNGFDAVCFDNCYWGITPYGKNPDPNSFSATERAWTSAYMDFYKEAMVAVRREGLKCYVNVSTTASEIPDAFRLIYPYVDGLLTEMAFHPKLREEKFLKRELAAYEAVLKQGKMVFLIPRYRKDESFGLIKIAPLARRYKKIYLTASGPVHEQSLYILE